MKYAIDSISRIVIIFVLIGVALAFHPIWNFFKTLSPSKGALVNIATIEGVLITIALPLSFEIVSRISERYGSESVINSFLHEWINKLLLVYLIFNISVVVFMSEASSKIMQASEVAWQIISWVVFILFIVGLGLFAYFTRVLNRYVADPSYVTEKLAVEAEEALE